VKTLIVVQARTGSSRLPNKVLLPLSGKPLLQRMAERITAAHSPLELVIATTTDPADDAISTLCDRLGLGCFRGHPTDLLDRHYRAARAWRADVVVKIPSDCPLIDPAVIDQVLQRWTASSRDVDFVSNLHPATWPDGNDVEVMSFAALELAFRQARRPHEREHTTPFIWDQPDRFRIANVLWSAGLDYSMTHRFTIDYLEDYQFVTAVYDALWTPARRVFPLEEILSFLKARPDVFAINSAYAGVNWYRDHLGQLRTVGPECTRQPGRPSCAPVGPQLQTAAS